MIKGVAIDPRTKLFMVTCISTLGVMTKKIPILGLLVGMVILLNIALKSPMLSILKRFRKYLFFLVMMVCIQSLFIAEGTGIITIGNIHLINYEGIARGLTTIMRMAIMLLCGSFLITTSSRVFIQGLIQLKVPYELAFMVMIGLKWLPILSEEFQDGLRAIELRGINPRQLPLTKRIRLYIYMITPVLLGTISRVHKMAIAMHCKGLRAMPRRTSYFRLRFHWFDFGLMTLSVVLSLGILVLGV